MASNEEFTEEYLNFLTDHEYDPGCDCVNCLGFYDYDNDDTLGPCGCTDYHMSDCPTRTGYGVNEFGDDYGYEDDYYN